MLIDSIKFKRRNSLPANDIKFNGQHYMKKEKDFGKSGHSCQHKEALSDGEAVDIF